MSRYASQQRADILDAAIGVFAERDLDGATIRMVADRAGVNSALLYYYYENKESLFRECIRKVLDGFLDKLGETRGNFRNSRERLAYLVDGILDYYTAYPDRMRLIGRSVSVHAALFARVLSDLPRRRPLLPLEVLQQGMDCKELRRMNPLQAWWSIIGMCMFNLYVEDILPHIQAAELPFALPDLPARRGQILDVLQDGMRLHTAPRKRSQKGA